MGKLRKYRRLLQASVGIGLLVYYIFCLPSQLFDTPYSTVLEDRNGHLLGAMIASDGQWRFPASDSVPDKFTTALLHYEDEHFYDHIGFNPASLLRATWQNLKARRVVSGGSTITMQVVRLSRKGRSRTILEKVRELIFATRIEWSYTKNEILALHASHAPFGGNIVGLKAATWRYFGRGPEDLSWGEAATLAVLPNSPSLIHPGRNRDQLRLKRDQLLNKLMAKGVIDTLTAQLAMAERIPDNPKPLPQIASHLLIRSFKEGLREQRITSTIDIGLQENVDQIVNRHYQQLRFNGIHNAAALVLDVETGEALAYVGNTRKIGPESSGNAVDIITAPRSTGSILKPFLYAAMLNEGQMLPKTLVPDVPTFIQGFAPTNFARTYDGAIAADRALARSLNIPAVLMLRDYRYEKFHSLLQDIGMTTLHRPADHYGLSLVLGGAEGNLWDITGAYASMARTLNHHFEGAGSVKYDKNDFHAPVFTLSNHKAFEPRDFNSILNAGAIWTTFQAMLEVYRPDDQSSWKLFETSKKIAWKTGTSYGFRDAWAVGVTDKYAVGVWVGNADGEGRPGLTGIKAAAPIMFDIFSLLPKGDWFSKPESELIKVPICRLSGYRVSPHCDTHDKIWIPKEGLNTVSCPFHKVVHLTKDGRQRVNTRCASVSNMVSKPWFVLPPVQEYYYRSKNAFYKVLPPYKLGCSEENDQLRSMQVIYPRNNTKIYIPKELDGHRGGTIFEVAHRIPNSQIHWHLNGEYLGHTKRIHQMELAPTRGNHSLTLIDQNGELIETNFEIISK
ncbi:MAG: penicillin-binding protein 1C [Bacteroidota bacterium]